MLHMWRQGDPLQFLHLPASPALWEHRAQINFNAATRSTGTQTLTSLVAGWGERGPRCLRGAGKGIAGGRRKGWRSRHFSRCFFGNWNFYSSNSEIFSHGILSLFLSQMAGGWGCCLKKPGLIPFILPHLTHEHMKKTDHQKIPARYWGSLKMSFEEEKKKFRWLNSYSHNGKL